MNPKELPVVSLLITQEVPVLGIDSEFLGFNINEEGPDHSARLEFASTEGGSRRTVEATLLNTGERGLLTIRRYENGEEQLPRQDLVRVDGTYTQDIMTIGSTANTEGAIIVLTAEFRRSATIVSSDPQN